MGKGGLSREKQLVKGGRRLRSRYEGAVLCSEAPLGRYIYMAALQDIVDSVSVSGFLKMGRESYHQGSRTV